MPDASSINSRPQVIYKVKQRFERSLGESGRKHVRAHIAEEVTQRGIPTKPDDVKILNCMPSTGNSIIFKPGSDGLPKLFSFLV